MNKVNLMIPFVTYHHRPHVLEMNPPDSLGYLFPTFSSRADSTFYKFLYLLFFYFWLHWVFVAVHGLSLVVASGGYSSLQCAGFSLRWLLIAEHEL